MGNNFFLKGIFLGGNFGEHVLEEQILLGRKYCQQNFWRISCEENVIRGKKRILGSKNVLEERYGEQKFLRANCYLKWFLHRTNLNTSVRKMLDLFLHLFNSGEKYTFTDNQQPK